VARKFHRKNRLDALTEINVTPLIDLAFALLIIFMITTPLLEQTIPVDLPIESAAPQPENRDEFLSVSIDKDGRYAWGEEYVTVVELGDYLDTLAANPNPPVLSIRADGSLPYQEVVTVMDMIKQRKISKISLDTKAE